MQDILRTHTQWKSLCCLDSPGSLRTAEYFLDILARAEGQMGILQQVACFQGTQSPVVSQSDIPARAEAQQGILCQASYLQKRDLFQLDIQRQVGIPLGSHCEGLCRLDSLD